MIGISSRSIARCAVSLMTRHTKSVILDSINVKIESISTASNVVSNTCNVAGYDPKDFRHKRQFV